MTGRRDSLEFRPRVSWWIQLLLIPIGCFVALTGCVEEAVQPHAECSNGDTRTLPCGVLQLGEQMQVCTQFLWEDIGSCSEELHCAPADTRAAPCGLNMRGEVKEICGNNQWKPIGDCRDEDVCLDGAEESDPCGLNGRGHIARLCEEGRWTAQACIDPDSCVDDSIESELCQAIGATEYKRQRRCEEGHWSDEWSDCEAVACQDGEVDLRDCGIEGRGVIRERCVGGQWSSTNECEMRGESVSTNETLLFLIESDGSLWVSGGGSAALAGRAVAATDQGTIREPFVARVHIQSEDHLALGPAHACIIQQGEVHCWGDNSEGQLGVSASQGSARAPVRVPGVGTPSNPAVQVVVTPKVSCALLLNGEAYCWGTNSTGGGVGAGRTGVRAPVRPAGLPTANRLFAREQMICARVQNGDVYCWGDNIQSLGLLGIGAARVLPGGVGGFAIIEPTRVPGLRRPGRTLVDLHLYRDDGCALYSDGAVFCWGLNKNGEVGNGTTDKTSTPRQTIAPGNHGAVSLHTTAHRRCARMVGESILCWGRQPIGDQNARLLPNTGDRATSPELTPRFDDTHSSVTSLSVSDKFACAVHEDDVVRCTGVTVHGSFGREALSLSQGPAQPALCPSMLEDW